MVGENKENYLSWKGWDCDSFGSHSKWHRSFFNSELKRTGVSNIESVLEIGFGNGEFMSFAVDSGLETVGVELNDELVGMASSMGYESYSSLSDIPSGKRFDVVAIFDVLEHIDQVEIPGFLAEVKNKLNPGGAILARFPNGDSPLGRIHQHGDVTHKTTIGSGKIRYFADSVGLSVRYCGAPSMPIFGSPAKYAIYNLFARPIRWIFDRFFGFLYLQRVDVTFSPNLTVVLALD
ncbi:class I SAM-dependent methyltransferase [Pseudomonas sp. NPDC087814]|uniref:class I SAM-dependent methyltransferase n=1 Tax=unclassified Pseudomonas TaxID=196821 RepID=UPI000B3FF805|nr:MULTISPECIES: class I SAM-dependent methyltransferase [unclassified Pseudomonas]NWC71956.1 class I SAM-dependent methyltransferase [Pseudomonas sp. P7758]NWD65799.1 class I SAM-dependent methyltransferase [Pseudomonas sp. IPO3774]NWD86048.1 class I SAM-dependent methyltransferase [Pseudomonas sp. K5002]